VAQLTPSLLAVLPDAPLPALETVVSAGEACPVDVARRWGRGRRFLNGYGPTEATVGTCFEVVDSVDGLTSVPIGPPIANSRVLVLDEDGDLTPDGEVGELFIGGINVAHGYVGRPDLTAERFVEDRFHPGGRLYRTGDRVRWAPGGVLEFRRAGTTARSSCAASASSWARSSMRSPPTPG